MASALPVAGDVFLLFLLYAHVACIMWMASDIESQSGKASVTVTVVVQCDGSQGDSCGECEQQLPIPPNGPHIIITATVLLLSKVRIGQSKLCAITVDVTCRVVTTFLVHITMYL